MRAVQRYVPGMDQPLVLDDWPPAPIRTERLLLRPPEARDRQAFVDLGSDPTVNHHLGGGRDRATLDSELPEVPSACAGQALRPTRPAPWT